MKGKSYNSFDQFRIEFWKLASRDSRISSQFSSSNVSRMRQDLAPKVVSAQQLGKQTSYISHHKTSINQGGLVFDVDNLIIVTPRYHKEILLTKYHFGYGY